MDRIVTQSLRSLIHDENFVWWQASAMMVMVVTKVNSSNAELVLVNIGLETCVMGDSFQVTDPFSPEGPRIPGKAQKSKKGSTNHLDEDQQDRDHLEHLDNEHLAEKGLGTTWQLCEQPEAHTAFHSLLHVLVLKEVRRRKICQKYQMCFSSKEAGADVGVYFTANYTVRDFDFFLSKEFMGKSLAIQICIIGYQVRREENLDARLELVSQHIGAQEATCWKVDLGI